MSNLTSTSNRQSSSSRALGAIALILCAAPGFGQEQPMDIRECEIFEGLVERWEGAVESMGVPGCSMAIIMDGEVYACGSFGVRNPVGDPVDADTMFYIASVTKTFTAGALARLSEQGRVDLDAPVQQYLPRFKLANKEATRSITVRDLLCHRPGINSRPIVFLDAYTGQITEDRFYYWLEQVEPLGAVNYTNVHFTLAGRVLESITGKPWKDALDEQIFTPTGMRRTTAYASRMYSDENVAFPMERDASGRFVACKTRKTDMTMHAAGGSGTTARDGARWVLLQLRDGEIDGTNVLSPKTARAMRTYASRSEPRGNPAVRNGFGMGWMLGSYRDHPYVTHGGGYVGTAAHLSFLPEEGLGVVVLANGSPSGTLFCDLVSGDIYDRLLGEEGHEDMLPRMVERLKQRTTPEPAPDNLVAANQLSVDPRIYAGVYSNEHWGEITFSLGDGELSARFGQLAMTLEADGRDRFLARTSAGDEYNGILVVEDERVLQVVLDDDGTLLRFERVE
ncbi:MAG: CubicO group peptidase (beta-lactamase class C family) [Chlamydiales bacterium]|jgi:CubicO group peptidase (beta-lactamase class C family)